MFQLTLMALAALSVLGVVAFWAWLFGRFLKFLDDASRAF